LIIDGKIYRGATGSAGEIGHISYEPDGPLCKCGNRGCIERYLGAPYLSMQAKSEIEKEKQKGDVILKLIKGDLDALTPRVLAEAAQKGDPLAKRLWQESGRRLGIVLAGIINLLNPDMIILAGGVSKAGNLLLDPVKETISERAFKTPARVCKVVISKYTQKLGVVGAALLAKQ
jgi:glucokinase